MLDALFGAEEEFEYTATTTPEPQLELDDQRERAGQRQLVAHAHSRLERAPAGRPSSLFAEPATPAPLAGRPARWRAAMAAAADSAPSGSRARRPSASSRRCATSVGARGAAGSTFDHVAREAGVSRGLLHYYFGSKERLLVEVVRHDCEVRIALLDERSAAGRRRSTRSSTRSSVGLEEFLEGDAGSPA